VTGLDAARALVARVRAAGGTVVATGGVFDPLHAGHVESVAAARRLGDCLLVLVNSDDSVRRRHRTPAAPPADRAAAPLSGRLAAPLSERLAAPLSERLAAPLSERLAAVATLPGVDAVVSFDADDPRAVLDALRPDLWVKGGDHDPADLPETPLVRSWGGEVVAVPYRATGTEGDTGVRAEGAALPTT
jgi:cytidyltransferase-like protein